MGWFCKPWLPRHPVWCRKGRPVEHCLSWRHDAQHKSMRCTRLPSLKVEFRCCACHAFHELTDPSLFPMNADRGTDTMNFADDMYKTTDMERAMATFAITRSTHIFYGTYYIDPALRNNSYYSTIDAETWKRRHHHHQDTFASLMI